MDSQRKDDPFHLISTLPLEVEISIFLHLEVKQLASIACVSKSWHSTIDNAQFWRECTMKHLELGKFANAIPPQFDWKCLFRASWKRNRSRSLLTKALGASSTDHAEERCSRTLYDSGSYWSSGPSDSEGTESLLYSLVNFGMIRSFEVSAYQAYWQPGAPIYSPQEIQFSLKDANGDNVIVSRRYTFEHSGRPQIFRLEKPWIVRNNQLEIMLYGKHQIQMADDLFYTCIRYIKAVGIRFENCRMECAPVPVLKEVSADELSEEELESDSDEHPRETPINGHAGQRFLQLFANLINDPAPVPRGNNNNNNNNNNVDDDDDDDDDDDNDERGGNGDPNYRGDDNDNDNGDDDQRNFYYDRLQRIFHMYGGNLQ